MPPRLFQPVADPLRLFGVADPVEDLEGQPPGLARRAGPAGRVVAVAKVGKDFSLVPPVLASAAGTVSAVGTDGDGTSPAHGNHVYIDHGGDDGVGMVIASCWGGSNQTFRTAITTGP